MRLNDTYSARLLSAKTDRNGVQLETYAIHPTGEYGAIAQVELFKGPTHAQWTYWSGSSISTQRHLLGRLCEKVRNES